jgi:hypothetical protein
MRLTALIVAAMIGLTAAVPVESLNELERRQSNPGCGSAPFAACGNCGTFASNPVPCCAGQCIHGFLVAIVSDSMPYVCKSL